MDKASASGAGDSRFESWAGHCHCFVYPLSGARQRSDTRGPLALLSHITSHITSCAHCCVADSSQSAEHTRATCNTTKTDSSKAGSTRGCSQAVPHPSTNRALCRLTSEVRRDPVHTTWYGRQQSLLRRVKRRKRHQHPGANMPTTDAWSAYHCSCPCPSIPPQQEQSSADMPVTDAGPACCSICLLLLSPTPTATTTSRC